jgi:hypothetical protein
MNPQQQTPNVQPGNNDFLAAVGNARPDQLDVTSTRSGDVQMNVVNAVNANGIVSGRKVVDFIWQRVAICAMVIGGGLLIAIIAMLFFINSLSVSDTKARTERGHAEKQLNEIYSTLGVEDQSGAIKTIRATNIWMAVILSRLRLCSTRSSVPFRPLITMLRRLIS